MLPNFYKKRQNDFYRQISQVFDVLVMVFSDYLLSLVADTHTVTGQSYTGSLSTPGGFFLLFLYCFFILYSFKKLIRNSLFNSICKPGQKLFPEQDFIIFYGSHFYRQIMQVFDIRNMVFSYHLLSSTADTHTAARQPYA